MKLVATFRSRIQLKLLTIFFMALGLMLMTSTIVLLLSMSKLGKSSIQRQLDEEKMILSQHVMEIETELLETVIFISQHPAFIDNLTQSQDNLRTSLAITAEVLGQDAVWLFDQDQQILAQYTHLDTVNITVQDFQSLIPVSDQPVVQMTAIDQTYMMLASAPLMAQDGQVLGYVAVANRINADVLGEINFYRDSLAFVLFPEDSRMIGIGANEADHVPHLTVEEVEHLRLPPDQLEQIQEGHVLRFYNVTVRDTPHALAYMPFIIDGRYQGYYVIAIDENEPRAIQFTILTVSVITIFVVVAVIGYLVVLSLWHVVLYPLQVLSRAASHFGQGYTSTRLHPTSIDEMGQLYRTFNIMAERIDTRTQELNQLNSELEDRVHERTVQVERQTIWLESIFRQAKEAIIVADADGNITIANDVALKILSQTETAIRGASLYQLIDQVTAERSIQLPLVNEEVQGELEIHERFYQFSIATLDTAQTMGGHICVLIDVTHLRRLNALQAQVIRIAAHDLRSPITSLGLQLHMLKKADDNLSDNQQEIIIRLQQTIHNIRDMVDNLLNTERIEKQLDGMDETVVLQALIASILTMIEPQLTEKRQQITVNIADDLPLLSGDPVRLLEVLRNLLTNAHKYTPAGGQISLSACVQGTHIQIDVQDNGIGIDTDDLPYIFDDNFRAKTARTSGIDGSGVGLGLARAIIHEHGGDISAHSERGIGTCFSVLLPIPEHLPIE
ncbi:MAG: ATP-binding protein [Anaerolineae bacterium]